LYNSNCKFEESKKIKFIGGISVISLLLLLLVGILFIFSKWWWTKSKNAELVTYIIMLGITPLVSFIILKFLSTIIFLDFFSYLWLAFLTSILFASSWIISALKGEVKKVEFSMCLVAGAILMFFMMSMAFIEILPNDILINFLNPLISKGAQYDILSRPPYQISHFIVYLFVFPYIASFIIGMIILKFEVLKNVGVQIFESKI
jgi:hypothetical protein